MDKLIAPFAAPTSSFVLDDDATAGSSSHVPTPTATASLAEQQVSAGLDIGQVLSHAQSAAATTVSIHHSSQIPPHAHQQQVPGPVLTTAQPQEQHMEQAQFPPTAAGTTTTPQELYLSPQNTVAAVPPKEASTGAAVSADSPTEAADAAALQEEAPAIVDVLGQLAGNAADIRAAEIALQDLLTKQHSLRLLLRKLEQQRVVAAVLEPLGFHQGRPVAALLLLRCFEQWGVLTADCAPVLDQLAWFLQQQLSLEDESAPAEVAGLQCHVAYWLTVSAVLLCLLLKTTNPQLAAAAAAQNRAGSNRHMASEVMTAARRRVGELQQQLADRVGHMGGLQGGLQALGKRFKGWGKPSALPQGLPQGLQHGGSGDVLAELEEDRSTSSALLHSASAGDDFVSAACGEAHTNSAAAAAAARSPASLQVLLLCLDMLVQRSFTMLRDQLKRRLAPLLSDCMVHPGLTAGPDSLTAGPDSLTAGPDSLTATAAAAAAGPESLTAHQAAFAGLGTGFLGPPHRSSSSSSDSSGAGMPLSPAAGSAVAGAAAASAAEAEAALLCYRSWSEVVGVMHAAVVALRGAGVPRALTAALVQQVLEFINCQLFNQLLLRPECCSASNARYVLRGLKQLDGWLLAEHGSTAGYEAAAAAARGGAGGGSSDAAAAAAGVVESASSGVVGGKQSMEQKDEQQEAVALGEPAAAAAAAAAGVVEGGSDGAWEQVPADTGEIDSWQPPKQQQQQSRVRLWQWQVQQQQQQQPQQGPLLQHDIGPEAWHALSHIRQALQFLVLERKGSLGLDELAGQVCPVLSHQQLYRLCTTAWDDTPGDDRCVAGEVLEQMKQRHALSTNGGLIVTYLLDEPAALPFVQPAAAAAAAGGDAAGFFSSSSSAMSAAAGSSSSGWRCRPNAVVLWDDGRDYGAGMPVPQQLVDEGCPAAVFAFLEQEQHWVQF